MRPLHIVRGRAVQHQDDKTPMPKIQHWQPTRGQTRRDAGRRVVGLSNGAGETDCQREAFKGTG